MVPHHFPTRDFSMMQMSNLLICTCSISEDLHFETPKCTNAKLHFEVYTTEKPFLKRCARYRELCILRLCDVWGSWKTLAGTTFSSSLPVLEHSRILRNAINNAKTVNHIFRIFPRKTQRRIDHVGCLVCSHCAILFLQDRTDQVNLYRPDCGGCACARTLIL